MRHRLIKVYLGNSKLESIVTLSTLEAKYKKLSKVAKDITWLLRLFKDLYIQINKIH